MGAAQNYVSVSRRPPDIEDYIDMARRYRSWIVGPMFLGLVVAVVAAFLQPDTFVSYAVMRITPQQVPEKLVPSVLSTAQLTQRVDQLKTEILSRNTLVDIIQKPSLDLYKNERNRLPMEDVVQTMKTRDIHISALNAAEHDGRLSSAFQISFRYTDKYKASAVVRELVSRFENMNVTVLRSGAQMTNSFLTDEKEKAKERMEKLGVAITKFEMENQGRLPQEAQSNASQLMQVRMALMNINSNITRDMQEKALLNTHLDNLRNQQNYLEANLQTVIPGSGPSSIKNEKLLNLSKAISDKKSILAGAKRTYGDNYPEINRMQAEITSLEQEQDDLQKEEAAQQTTTAGIPPRTVVNSQVERQILDYKSQLKDAQTQMATKTLEIEELNKQKAELEKQDAMYQRRIDEAPLNEQQYAQLKSDFELAKTDYEDFQKKQHLSETSQNLEEHKAGENLDVLDPANVPDKAVDPDRLAWAGGGVFGGMIIGLVLAAAKEVKDTSLKNLKDVRAYTNLPVLSSIPLLENALLVRRKRRLVWLAWSSATVVGITLMAGSVYYYMMSST